MKKTVLLCIAFLAIDLLSIHAQSLYRVSLDQKIQHSNFIVEGKVTSQKSFWNTQHTMIYTSSKIEVYKVFKGLLTPATIEIATAGGALDGRAVIASDLAKLKEGETGVFFCNPISLSLKSPDNNGLLFDLYSSAQGVYEYDLNQQKAATPFETFDDIETKFYPTLTQKIGKAFKDKNPSFSVRNFAKPANRTMAATITSFSPAVVRAGAFLDPANNTLTINGSGFGTGAGSAAVLFSDADKAAGSTLTPIAYNHPLMISWADNQIKLKVPTDAGTYTFYVRTSDGTMNASPTPLIVDFSVQSVIWGDGLGNYYPKETNLMNFNGTGGYTIHYSQNTAGSGVDLSTHVAKATFQRALTTWKENAGFNITEGANTNNQLIADDGENVILFDNANAKVDPTAPVAPLPDGVLAICFSYFDMCGDFTAYQMQKTGFDIIIRNPGYSTGSTAFTYGPCPPLSSNYGEIDLESVLLHELGHAIGLGHIVDDFQGVSGGYLNSGKVMHYAITNGVRRISLDYSAKIGSQYLINQQGNAYGNCGLAATEMTPLSTTSVALDDCPVTFPATQTPAGTVVNFDLVHASSSRLVDPAYNQVRSDGLGTGVTNNSYYALKTDNSGGSLTLTVTNYTTVPGSEATCTQAYGGYPVTGIKLALYQVNSCPGAGSFPAPFVYRTFSGNGALSPITGLAANTNYLLYVDGIENTKASFSMKIGGTILPLTFSSFYGKELETYNQIFWTTEDLINVSKIIVQRSENGNAFEDIGEVKDFNQFKNGNFKDLNPLPEKNYYRLVALNLDGSKDYSNAILLKRQPKTFITIYPNPAKDDINVYLPTSSADNYSLQLYNSFGQLVKESTSEKAAKVLIPVKQFGKGIYQLKITNTRTGETESHKVVIQ